MKSSMRTVRVPLFDAMVRLARQASRVGTISEMGEAVTTLPPRQATFRI